MAFSRLLGGLFAYMAFEDLTCTPLIGEFQHAHFCMFSYFSTSAIPTCGAGRSTASSFSTHTFACSPTFRLRLYLHAERGEVRHLVSARTLLHVFLLFDFGYTYMRSGAK